ncbi:MAG: 30S ribosomal protein S12 methylthiotransferase RimO [Paludibacteraceae bacterium]|nr:30S ribosomal protein S12 methylthiotransferase RimO [Paludibacteraceae bacterium]
MNKGEIDIITLGCSKNLVDAERLMRQLEVAGYKCVHDPAEPRGEIAVINTCGFIGDAKEESINTILQFIERKKKHQLKKLYVMGCLSERYLADLEQELPEVDKYFGKFDFMGIVEEVKKTLVHAGEQQPQAGNDKAGEYERVLTTPKHYAYLKIAEGCNRFCSYCAIPLITGRYKSRKMEEVVDEVRWLVSKGVRELQVIAQDLTYYGTDLYGESKIAELVSRISEVEGVRWIRLHYAYPTRFPLDLLPVIREKKNVCKYLDIALQHSTDHMLSMMRRHITHEEQTSLIRKIREEVPGIHLRTTMMVGHPGETEEDFEELMQWVSDMRFERLGAFAYSNEEGTYAAENYEDNIPQEVKERRLDKLMSLQEEIAADINRQKEGKTLSVVIDREEADYYIGRTEFDSPEVDCEVLIAKDKKLQTGEWYEALITEADTFDLYARII